MKRTRMEWFRFATKHFPPENSYAVTLNLKQSAFTTIGSRVNLCSQSASQNLRHLLNLINRQTFGNQFKRKKKRLDCFPIMERSTAGNLHYHLILRNTYCEDYNLQAMKILIKELSNKTWFGYGDVEVRPHEDHGWVDYILKAVNDNNTDMIDVDNLNVTGLGA